MKALVQGTGGLINNIVILLNQALHQAGVVINHLYLVLVKQQFLYGIQEALLGLFYLIAGIIAYRFYLKVEAKTEWDSLDRHLVIALLLIVVAGATYFGLSHIVSSVTRIFNPEYYAIQDGLKMIQQLRSR
jgi:predicted transporter